MAQFGHERGFCQQPRPRDTDVLTPTLIESMFLFFEFIT